MPTVFHARLHGIFINIKSDFEKNKLYRANQSSNFFGGSFGNGGNVRAPIQFPNLERRQSQYLKIGFFLKNRPIYFHSNSTRVIRPVKQNNLSFSRIEITNHFLPKSTVPRRSGSSSKANSGCCHKSDAWSHLRVQNSIISLDSNITDNIIRKVIDIE